MTNRQLQPTDPSRIRSFASFFKNYMSISSLVTAALPIPLTLARFIPTYSAQTKMLSVYTSLFCFLLLSFTFFSRHQLARWMFSRYILSRLGAKEVRPGTGSKIVKWLPLILMVLCLVAVFTYHAVLRESITFKERVITTLAFVEVMNGVLEKKGDLSFGDMMDSLKEKITKYHSSFESDRDKHDTYSDYILKTTDLTDIHYHWQLMCLYILLFLSAEAAFVLMALKEYLQDLMGISDLQLLGIDEQRKSTV